MLDTKLIQRGMRHIWYPCSQMKDYETFEPIVISKAYGSYIELQNGDRIIDAISSWWCKSLGHSHPRLQQALMKQMHKFEHCMMPNTINDTIAELSEKLANLTPYLKKVFYACDGSTAVEIALKMSLQALRIQGNTKKKKFIALQNGYHGETAAALSVSDIGKFKDPYKDILFDVNMIPFIPYVGSSDDPLWYNCDEHWQQTEMFLEPYIEETAAIIVEPLVQAVGGMKIYSQDFLSKLGKWAKKHNVYLICDEIMTGIGRTGKMLASDYANIEPDFICLGKGLTAGWLPLSAVLTSNTIYDMFYDDYESGKSFLHSNTYAGNALAASVALETLNIFEDEKICNQAIVLGDEMLKMMNTIADSTNLLTNVRGLGCLVAADLKHSNENNRLGYEVFKKAVSLGAWLRPLNNTIYWAPPLNTRISTLEELGDITIKALQEANYFK